MAWARTAEGATGLAALRAVGSFGWGGEMAVIVVTGGLRTATSASARSVLPTRPTLLERASKLSTRLASTLRKGPASGKIPSESQATALHLREVLAELSPVAARNLRGCTVASLAAFTFAPPAGTTLSRIADRTGRAAALGLREAIAKLSIEPAETVTGCTVASLAAKGAPRRLLAIMLAIGRSAARFTFAAPAGTTACRIADEGGGAIAELSLAAPRLTGSALASLAVTAATLLSFASA
jgi:hypothetical protein